MRFNEFKESIPDDGTRGGQEPNRSTGLEAGPPYPRDEMDNVRALQTRLQELGYSVGNTGVDGKYGPRTSRAVKAYKTDFNVEDPTNGRSITNQEITAMQSAEKKEDPTPTGNENAGGGAATYVDLPDPEGDEGSVGQLRINSAALLTLDGGQSRLTRSSAEREMQETLQMAREVAGLFGQPLRIRDAIARDGTSRERNRQGSQHFNGTALDLDVGHLSNEEKLQLLNACIQVGFTGYGLGESTLHIDRGTARFWTYSSTYGGLSANDVGLTAKAGRRVTGLA